MERIRRKKDMQNTVNEHYNCLKSQGLHQRIKFLKVGIQMLHM